MAPPYHVRYQHVYCHVQDRATSCVIVLTVASSECTCSQGQLEWLTSWILFHGALIGLLHDTAPRTHGSQTATHTLQDKALLWFPALVQAIDVFQ